MRTTRVPRLAALALSLGLLVATGSNGPAALAAVIRADDQPDLTVTVAATPNPVVAGGTLTYGLTVKNPTIRIWDPELRVYYNGGADTSGVVVRDTLAGGAQFVSASGDSGFSCSQASGVVTCSGGAIPMNGTGRITINTRAPSALGSATNTATVDPNNAIVERSETNNTASTATTVAVDLVASISTILDRITFTVTNASTVSVSNVAISVTEPSVWMPGFISQSWNLGCWASGGAGFTDYCIADNIPPLGTASFTLQAVNGDRTFTLVVDPSNSIAEANEANNTAVATLWGYP
jgi:hypothetical protein